MNYSQKINWSQTINGRYYEFKLCVNYNYDADCSDGEYWCYVCDEQIDAANSEAHVQIDEQTFEQVDIATLLGQIDQKEVFQEIDTSLDLEV